MDIFSWKYSPGGGYAVSFICLDWYRECIVMLAFTTEIVMFRGSVLGKSFIHTSTRVNAVVLKG